MEADDTSYRDGRWLDLDVLFGSYRRLLACLDLVVEHEELVSETSSPLGRTGE